MPRSAVPEERLGATLAGAAVAWLFILGAWGIAGLFPDGHFASTANGGVIGYNMSRYDTLYAFWPFLERAPPLSTAYLDHPMGMFWIEGFLIKVFGPHDWVVRLPPLVYFPALAFFLYRAGRAIWGPIEGGLAAFAYGSLPITLGFTTFNSLEQPVMLGCLIATWGYVRLQQTRLDRYAWASVAGFAFAVLHDWQAYLWGAAFVTFVFFRAFVIPERWLGPVDARRTGRYWALMVGTAIVCLALTIGMIINANHAAEVLGMYTSRSLGREMPLAQVLLSRRIRIELMFTPIAIAIGKLAAPVIVARLFIRKNELEILPLFILIAATVQYVVFKQGADVHIFWPLPFATYFGLAVGALAATIRDVWAWAAPRLRERWPRGFPDAGRAPFVAAALLAVPLLLVLRDGASLVRLARETGGRFMEVNLDSQIDQNTALLWFLDRFPSRAEQVAFHPSIPKRWNTEWELRPRQVAWKEPIAGPGPRPYMLDARATSVGELREAARRYHIVAVGWFWLMDRGAAPAPLDGYSFDEHDPGLLSSLAYGPTEPLRHVVADPWVTWEWRTLLGQPATPPPGEPRTTDQIRIAHNLAISRGDHAAADRYRAALLARLRIRTTARWSNGLELIGTARHTGAARSLTPYFLVGPTPACAHVALRARVTGRRWFSTLPVDPAELDVASPPGVPCDLWRPGFIYSAPIVYRHRAGHERFTLGLLGIPGQGPPPVRLDGPPWIPLLTL